MSDEPQPTGEPCLRCRTELQSLGQTDLRTGGSVRSAGDSSSGSPSEADQRALSAQLAPH